VGRVWALSRSARDAGRTVSLASFTRAAHQYARARGRRTRTGTLHLLEWTRPKCATMASNWRPDERASRPSRRSKRAPAAVGIDGGYLRHWEHEHTHFVAVVRKSVLTSGQAKCFGFVQSQDARPRRRLVATLRAQGPRSGPRNSPSCPMARTGSVDSSGTSAHAPSTCWTGFIWPCGSNHCASSSLASRISTKRSELRCSRRSRVPGGVSGMASLQALSRSRVAYLAIRDALSEV
jgi:hypothetical protein